MMANLIENFKFLLFILVMVKVCDCEIIPIHIGSPEHRHFVRTTPKKNEDNLRSAGLIPVNRHQVDSNQNSFIQSNSQFSLIPPSNNVMNQNFEYSKRIGIPAKRSTYLQNSRNIVDHSSYTPTLYTEANNNFYEREKQKVFNRDEMNSNYQSNTYQPTPNRPLTAVHQPQNYGYIPSNAANYDYHRNNQYDYGRNNVPNSHQYTGGQYNQPPVEPQHQAHFNPQGENSPDYQQNDLFEKELNDLSLDNSFYDMPLDQSMDSGHSNQMNLNDAMNFDSYFA